MRYACLKFLINPVLNIFESVALKNFFITFFSSALIIIAKVRYALLFAWFKVKPWLSIKLH